MSIPEWIVAKCFSVAATKPCPNRFSISDGSADYYMVEICDDRGEFLADTARMSDGQLPVLRFDGSDYVPHPDLPLNSIRPNAVAVTHYFSTRSYNYANAWCFLLGHYVNWSWLKFYFDRRSEEKRQREFNSQTLVVESRLEVLDVLVQMYLGGVTNVSVTLTITRILGTNRWVRHPQRDELLHRYRRIVRSWVDEGCLADSRTGYQILPRAISVLDTMQRDERRHSDIKRLNTWLVVLTACLVVTGLLQVLVTWVMSK